MTATEALTADLLGEHTLAAADAASRAIPGIDTWTAEPGTIDTLAPAPGSRAVQGQLGSATLLLVVDPELARHLQVGPPPADDLVEGIQPAFDAAAPLLAPVVDGAALGPLSELADVDGIASTTLVPVVVRLLSDGAHRASLVLLVPAPAAPGPGAGPEVTTPGGGVQFAPAAPARLTSVPTGLELLHDVEMGVTAELGRTRMLVREVLDLVPGSVIELDRAAGSPVDVLVNGTLIARGEVVVIDEEFGIRITEVVGHGDDRSR
jgi:flagellar motor switch protein FliN/FliY